MQGLRFSHGFAVALLFAVCALTSPSYADTLVLGPTDTNGICTGSTSGASCGGYQFTISFDRTTSVLTFTVQPGPNATPAYLQGFGLTMFNGTISATPSASNPAGFSIVNDAKINNGSGTCGNQTHPGSLCVFTPGNGLLIGSGLTLQFTISGWTGVQPSWHVMSTGTGCASGSSCGNVFALTNDGTPSTVPEPSSLVMLGSGLLGAVGVVRKKLLG